MKKRQHCGGKSESCRVRENSQFKGPGAEARGKAWVGDGIRQQRL